ncbi:MAG: hypothetical protein RIC55_23430 [Pirellulaceae bacterium]
MKQLGQILIFASLTTGALSAASAYHAWLDAPDEQLVGLTLNDGAGVKLEQGKAAPRFKKGHVLTAEDVEALRIPQPTLDGTTVDVTAVRVKEFSFARWQHKWGLTIFIASMLGMVGGSLLTRRASKRRQAVVDEEAEVAESLGPGAALKAIADRLVRLQDELAKTTDPHGREQAVIEQVGLWQQNEIPEFVDSHPELIDRYGIVRAAEVMERFAAAERLINRAWSAASDGDAEEAEAALVEAKTALDEARQRLKAA